MARELTRLTQQIDAAVAEERRAVNAAAQAEQQRARQARTRSLALARNRAATAVEELRSRCVDAVTSLAPGHLSAPWSRSVTGSVASGEYVRIGELAVAAEGLGLNSDVAVPFIVPLLDRGNVLIESDRADAPRAHAGVFAAALRLLAAVEPGRLAIRVFDPELRGLFAPLTALGAAGPDLLTHIGAELGALSEVLTGAAADLRRIAELCGTRASTLSELNRIAPRLREAHTLVVLLDFPSGFDRAALDLLRPLLRSGPRWGTSFLVHRVRGAKAVDDATAGDVDSATTILHLRGGSLTSESIPGLKVIPDQPPPPDVVRDVIARVAGRADTATAPKLPLSTILAPDEFWCRSSADGLRIVVGEHGLGPAAFTLGDEREQRHNVLVTGAVGQGKSNLLSVIIHSLAAHYSPDEVELRLLDFKDGVTFYPLAPTETSPDWLPHVRVIGVESDRQFGIAVLEDLFAEFERRATVIKPHGDSIGAYRRAVPQARMPRIVTIIDEFHVLFEDDDQLADRAAQLLERLARRGRAYGIHLVLASQTISGIAPLIVKSDGIFAQFPIRIALKNSASEARVALAIDNDEAAHLRFRGEAVLNDDFGRREGNKRIVVAAADPATTAELRGRAFARFADEFGPPRTFAGAAPMTWPELATSLTRLRRRPDRRLAVVGRTVTVDDTVAGIPVDEEPGRHLVVLGASDDFSQGASPLGILQAAAVSLAFQHSGSGVRFTIIDLIEGTGGLLRGVLEDIGVATRVVGRDELVPTLRAVAERLTRPAGEIEYLVGIGLDRAGSLSRPDDTFTAPIDALREILRDGPVVGTHVLGWWANAATYQNHLGFDGGPCDAVVVTRLDRRSVAELMGHTVEWNSPNNRALLFDQTYAPQPATIVPVAALADDDRVLLRKFEWDQ